MRFRDAIGPLLVAPLAGAIVVLSPILRLTPAPGVWPLAVLAAIVAALCYAAEAVLVLPIMLVWPSTRRPSLLVAAAWGAVAACVASAVVRPKPTFGWSHWLQEYGRPGTLLGFGFAGAVAGLTYAGIVRLRQR